MGEYKVKISPRALRDLDSIYAYIFQELKVPETAIGMIELLESAIYSLEDMPQRGAERKVGLYANKGYRQLFIKNYTIVYKIGEKEKIVVIHTVRYTPSLF
ncbi:MAG: type II toxin-antitoxin system RelE/ParE family toxin [Lachnospiraceae bacterium]|nr:type II toxin-antitoxin system RelE/ParE family toxin [Lachnospiraceae bacterium]